MLHIALKRPSPFAQCLLKGFCVVLSSHCPWSLYIFSGSSSGEEKPWLLFKSNPDKKLLSQVICFPGSLLAIILSLFIYLFV